MLRAAFSFLAACGLVACAGTAQAAFIDFAGFVHGEILDTDFLASDGLTISADNPNRSFDWAVVFDTSLSGTRDPDLEGPAGRLWDGGNVAPDEVFGNVLIVQENDTGCADDQCYLSDDETGTNCGGDLIFSFQDRMTRFGFDVVDIESGQAAGARVLFFDGAGPAVATVFFSEFECAVGPFCDGTVDFAGDNSANHLSDMTATALGITGFDRVVIDLNGSGGIDHLRFDGPQVPEPALAWLVLLALAWLGRAHQPSRSE